MVAAVIFFVSLFLIAASYLGYPLFLLVVRAIRGTVPRPSGDDLSVPLPSVTVLVPAYNEEQTIGARLDNLLELDFPKEKIEIIVISDCSTDQTETIVGTYLHRGVTLIRLPERGGKSAALNHAVPVANGEIIVLTDANAFFQADAVSRLVTAFTDPQVGCVVGCLKYTNTAESSTSSGEGLYWKYETELKKLQSQTDSLFFGNGSIYAIRRKLFSPVDGRTDDDTVVPLTIASQGRRVLYEPKAVALERASTYLQEEFSRKVRTVVRDFGTLLRVKLMLRPMRGWIALNIVWHKVLRWFVPFLLIMVFISNSLLISDSSSYAGLFFLQVIFYVMALAAYFALQVWEYDVRILYVPLYFCMINLANLVGIVKVLVQGEEIVVWEKARSTR